jgi:NAD+ kinase
VNAGQSQRVQVNRSARRIGLVLRPQCDLRDPLQQIERWAEEVGVALVGVDSDERLPASIERASEQILAVGCDAVLALGGDGTMLAALALAAPRAVPALGINLGRLGYLAEVDYEHLDRALTALGKGDYFVEGRAALVLRPMADADLKTAHGFNDVVFSRVPGRGQAALELRVDDELLVRYSSDGVIVATAQGSTAYSFAAGGPLVSPRASGMIITPDAPHGLFNRSVVVTEHEHLTVELLPGAAVSVEVDGRLWVMPSAALNSACPPSLELPKSSGCRPRDSHSVLDASSGSPIRLCSRIGRSRGGSSHREGCDWQRLNRAPARAPRGSGSTDRPRTRVAGRGRTGGRGTR